MDHSTEFKDFEPSEGIRKRLENLIAHLERKVGNFATDTVFLRVAMEEVPVHKLYRVSLTLDLPGKIVAAKEEAHDAEAALRSAFSSIERQTDTFKSDLRGEHWWKRLDRRKELRQMGIGSPVSERENNTSFFSLVDPHIDRLNQFARHILAYAEARGDLVWGELEPQDLVDQTLLRAYDEFLKERPPGEQF